MTSTRVSGNIGSAADGVQQPEGTPSRREKRRQRREAQKAERVRTVIEPLLEPGEIYQCEIRGKSSWGAIWLDSFGSALGLFGTPLNLAAEMMDRCMLLTDRNIYVCRSPGRSGKRLEVLTKYELGSVPAEYAKSGVKLAGAFVVRFTQSTAMMKNNRSNAQALVERNNARLSASTGAV